LPAAPLQPSMEVLRSSKGSSLGKKRPDRFRCHPSPYGSDVWTGRATLTEDFLEYFQEDWLAKGYIEYIRWRICRRTVGYRNLNHLARGFHARMKSYRVTFQSSIPTATDFAPSYRAKLFPPSAETQMFRAIQHPMDSRNDRRQ
jgi:hypothetical protein